MIRALSAFAILVAFSVSPALAQTQQRAVGVHAPAEPASIVVTISVPKQELTVVIDGLETYVWPISTAKQGALTPAGTFKVQSMNATAISRLFNDAPMPWAIFYDGHYAIHGTMSIYALGRPASMGCTRLHPENAKILFNLVKSRGPQSLQVIVVRDDKYVSSTSLIR